MYVYDQLLIVISSSGMGSHAWYGCWAIKDLVEADEVYDGFTVCCGGLAAPMIIASPLGVALLISNYKTSIKPV
jgi:hypothetical protein